MEKLDSDLRKLKLGSNLRKLLKKEHLSEAALARQTGIPQPMINRLAKDKNTNPKLDTLQPIVDYFAITFSQLLGEEPLPFDFDEETKLCKEVPLISLENLNKNIRPSFGVEIIPTNNLVTNEAFALKVVKEINQKHFPEKCLLIFEPKKTPEINDFILVKFKNEFKIEQVNYEKLKLIDSGKILPQGVLIEHRLNYF